MYLLYVCYNKSYVLDTNIVTMTENLKTLSI